MARGKTSRSRLPRAVRHPPDFHRQLQWLAQHGYEAVTLEQVQSAWFDGGRLPPKPVVISFDDGYRPQPTFALPQLREHGWAGVLNLKAEDSDLYDSNVEAMLGGGWDWPRTRSTAPTSPASTPPRWRKKWRGRERSCGASTALP